VPASVTLEVLDPGVETTALIERLRGAMQEETADFEHADPPSGPVRIGFSSADVDHAAAVERVELVLDRLDADNWRSRLQVEQPE
jgi:hypothetical protein